MKSLSPILLVMAVSVTEYVYAAAPDPLSRDAVGDLNAPSIRAGDFTDAIKLPGEENISLAIGGFVKTVVAVVWSVTKNQWTPNMRSTAMAGYAKSGPLDWHAGDTFKSTTYAYVNLMCSVQHFLTMSIEYVYGNRENKDGSDLDSHRIACGRQGY